LRERSLGGSNAHAMRDVAVEKKGPSLDGRICRRIGAEGRGNANGQKKEQEKRQTCRGMQTMASENVLLDGSGGGGGGGGGGRGGGGGGGGGGWGASAYSPIGKKEKTELQRRGGKLTQMGKHVAHRSATTERKKKV